MTELTTTMLRDLHAICRSHKGAMVAAPETVCALISEVLASRFAIDAARAFIGREREAYIECHTLPNDDGSRDMSVMEPMEREGLQEYDEVLTVMGRGAGGG